MRTRDMWLISRGLAPRPKLHKDQVKRYKTLFKMLDADGSGQLDITEIHEAMTELGMPAMVMEFRIAEDVDISIFEPGAALTITALLTLGFFFFNGPVIELEKQLVEGMLQ